VAENRANKQESAETLAIQALAWLLAQDDLVGAFLNANGADHRQMAVLAADPAFLGGVLDFLMEDDARVMAFCDTISLPYTAPMQARTALPGGQHWHWT
jgi:hypothetical protein